MSYEYQTIFAEESKTCAGVRVVYRKFTSARRREMRLETAEITDRLRMLAREQFKMQAKLEALGEDKTDPATLEMLLEMAESNIRMQDIDREINLIVKDELSPAWIKWGVVSVEGLMIDGKPATALDLPLGPEELYEEIVSAVQAQIGLTEEQRKNLSLLSISRQPAVGESKSTTATTAENPTSDSTASETAADSSLVQ